MLFVKQKKLLVRNKEICFANFRIGAQQESLFCTRAEQRALFCKFPDWCTTRVVVLHACRTKSVVLQISRLLHNKSHSVACVQNKKRRVPPGVGPMSAADG
ncbi:MAG: hypothetical protein ACI4O9_07850 [Akkermansia sp.]